MVSFYGDYNLTETVNIPFNTFSSDDPSASVTVTNLANGDVYVHKDGVEGTPTGITVSLNVGSVNGNHLAILDLSDTNDAGFYAVGARYQVRMEGVTIDGATVNAWIGAFSIGCTLRPTTAGRTFTVESDGVGHADVKELAGSAIQQASGYVKVSAGTGTGQLSLTSGVISSTVSDKTGFTLTNLSDANAAKLEDILDGTGGTGLTLNSLVITGSAAGGVVDIDNSGGPGIAVNGSTLGVDIDGASGSGIQVTGTTHGVEITASAGPGIEIDGTTFGIECDASAGPGIHAGGTTYGVEVTCSAGPGISAISSASGYPGMKLQGNGSGQGLHAIGGVTGNGLEAEAGATSGTGLLAKGSGAGGRGLWAVGYEGYPGLYASVTGGSAEGFLARGGAAGGAGFKAEALANNDAGMELVKHGTGKDIDADEIDDILTDSAELQTDDVPGLIAALNNLSAAQVNAQVKDCLDTDQMAELTGIATAPATPTIYQALMLLYMWLRNDTQATATERRILNDAGAEILDAAMADDGTTFTQGKVTAP